MNEDHICPHCSAQFEDLGSFTSHLAFDPICGVAGESSMAEAPRLEDGDRVQWVDPLGHVMTGRIGNVIPEGYLVWRDCDPQYEILRCDQVSRVPA